MNSDDLEKWQAKKIAQELYPGTNYLVRLLKRMEQLGFPPDDDLMRHVQAAYDATQRLYVRTHYLSCSGVGPPSVIGHKPKIQDGHAPYSPLPVKDAGESDAGQTGQQDASK